MRYAGKTFWIGAAERATKTAAQTLLSLVTVGQAITDIHWPGALAITATAVLASLLTSIADPDRADAAIASLGDGRMMQVDVEKSGKGEHH